MDARARWRDDARMPRLTPNELSLIAMALRNFSHGRIGDSLDKRNESRAQELRRLAERALALAERFERARVEQLRPVRMA
jgi:hypothetical protein